MSEELYEVVFRGDLAPGHHIDDVKEKLASLFKTNQEGIAHLFSGKLVIVRSGLDTKNATRYKTAMEGVGALASIRQQKNVNLQPDAQDPNSPGELTLAPLGADLLPRKTQHEDRTHSIPTDHISVAEPGSDVLSAEEKTPFVEKEIDTSHISVQ